MLQKIKFLTFFLSIIVLFSPSVAAESFDYGDYAYLLKRYVNEDGLVDYATLKEYREALDRFIEKLGLFPKLELEKLKDKEQIAFWINAYNAITLRVIIDHYPIQSRGIKGALYPSNSIRQIRRAWKRFKFQVAEQEVNLHTIEHDILRKKFKEPRIHMALVCASLGCPKLLREPYLRNKLEGQLKDQSREYLSDTTKFEKNKLYVSKIFDWFKKDFGGKDGIREFVKLYGPNEIKDKVTEETKVKWTDYDWSLNDQTDEPI